MTRRWRATTSALALKPDYAEAFYNRGNALQELKRFDEALASYDKALALKPDHEYAFGGAADCVGKMCDWVGRRTVACQLRDHIAAKSEISPFTALGYLNDQALLRQCAQNFIKNKIGNFPFPLWQGEVWHNDRIRLAYLSADFRRHATAYLLAELIERHDRERFEVIGVSLGPDDQSDMRARLIGAFDPLRGYDEEQRRRGGSEPSANAQVAIAVDLDGSHPICAPRHSGLSPGPDPGQLSRLSRHDRRRFHRLHHRRPDCRCRSIGSFLVQTEKDRSPAGLLSGERHVDLQYRNAHTDARGLRLAGPRASFSAAFNTCWKITPTVFAVWMRLLEAIPGSVLWLLRDNIDGFGDAPARGSGGARDRSGTSRLPAVRLRQQDQHPARHRVADPVPGHPALQRAHDGERRAVGRSAAVDVHGQRICGAGGGEPAECDRAARACDAQHRGLRGAGAAAGEAIPHFSKDIATDWPRTG